MNAEADRQPMLRLISGGKGPPVTSVNWLKDLKKGCVFTCFLKGNPVDLELLRIVFKHDRTVILADALNSNPPRAVNPEGFCNKYSYFETLEEGGIEPPIKEVDHDRPTGNDTLGS